MIKIKLTSQEWVTLTGITVYDPDGWNRKGDFNADWNKPITLTEFIYKCSYSTASYPAEFNRLVKDESCYYNYIFNKLSPENL